MSEIPRVFGDDKEKTAKLLKDALELMNDSGAHWTQGTYRTEEDSPDGKPLYCSLGALRHVAFEDVVLGSVEDEAGLHIYGLAVSALAEVVCAEEVPLGFGENRVIDFNDDPGRVWPEIVEAFTKAAERVEA